MNNPILVTGAGGFIGSHIVRRLAADPACTVIASTRDGRDGSRALDLRAPGTLRAALSGVGAVVHCAVGDRSVTVDGTKALLAAAAEAGVRRFVHLSSVAVYGTAAGTLTEQSPLVSATRPDYAGWKAAAEQACLAQPGLDIVRLRPAIVYGPGSALWIVQLARRIRSGRWGTFGTAGDGTCNLVHVRDVAESVASALQSVDIAGSAFNINGPEAMTWNHWFSSVAAAIGEPPLRKISPRVLKIRVAASLPLKAVARLSPGFAADWLLGSPARSELTLFALRAAYPTDAAKTALAWQPKVGVHEGLDECAAWLGDSANGTYCH